MSSHRDAPDPSTLEKSRADALMALQVRLGLRPGSDDCPAPDTAYTFPSEELRAWANPQCCCRYLRARNWNVGKAFTMLTATVAWRHTFFAGTTSGTNDAAGSQPTSKESVTASADADADAGAGGAGAGGAGAGGAGGAGAGGGGAGSAAADEDKQKVGTWDEGSFPISPALQRLDVAGLRAEMECGKMYVSKVRDKLGHPIVVNIKSKTPPKDHVSGMRMVVYNLEKAALAAEAAGQEKWVWIIDLANYTRANSPPMSISKQTLHIMSNHYPERLYRCFLVDAPWVFSISWSVLKHLADAVTAAKMAFLTNGPDHKDREKLLEVIDEDHLNTRFGGTYAVPYNFDDFELAARRPATTATSDVGGATGTVEDGAEEAAAPASSPVAAATA